MQDFFINPKLPTGDAYLGRDIVEEVEVVSTLFLVGDGSLTEFSTTDRAELFLWCSFRGHGLL